MDLHDQGKLIFSITGSVFLKHQYSAIQGSLDSVRHIDKLSPESATLLPSGVIAVEFFILLPIAIAIAVLFYGQRRTSDRVEALEKQVRQLQLEAALPDGVAEPGEEGAEERSEQPPTASGQTASAAETTDGLDAELASGEADDGEVPEDLSSEAAAARVGDGVAANAPWRKPVDLESLIGGRWSVILGGITVALGALFLVRYSMEAGLLGPAARIAAGVVLSVALLAGGEWLRRKDKREDLAPFMSADIPGVLTGAGAIGVFGTVYAAHAIYGFIGPAAAFILMTAAGLSCLLLASIHGPKLAAIGLLGSFAAPALVNSSTSNELALVLHTLIVSASVMAAARIRKWSWLAVGAVIGSLLWALALAFSAGFGDDIAVAIMQVGLAAIYAAGFGWQPGARPGQPEDVPSSRMATISFAALAIVTAIAIALVSGSVVPVIAALVGLIYVAAALLWPSLGRVAPWTGLIAMALALSAQLDPVIDPGLFDDRPYLGLPVPPDIGGLVMAFLLGAGPVAILALFAAWRAASRAPRLAGQFAIATSLIPVLGVMAIYLRISNFQTSIGIGVAALALAAMAVALTEIFSSMRPGDMRAPAPAAFAVAAISLIALAMGVMLTKTWLPFGMALTGAGVAWIHRSRPFKVLPWLVVILAVLSASGIYFNAPFAGEETGLTPFFNKLILIAGLPAGALLFAGTWLERSGTLRLGAIVNAIGLALLALFVALELRHFITGGEIAYGIFGLADMAVQSMAALGFAIGLQLVARRAASKVYGFASPVAGIIGLFMLFSGLGFRFNPLFTGDPVGEGSFFNLLLPGYLVTGIMAGIVVVMSRGVRPLWYRLGYGLAAGMLLFLYTTLMTRHAFQNVDLAIWRLTSEEEFWTYSAVWLAIGGVLLAAGFFTRSLPLRMASAALILLTIIKVFLLDMSALDGALRAFSFIGLGLALLVIGRFYQRILTRTREDKSNPA